VVALIFCWGLEKQKNEASFKNPLILLMNRDNSTARCCDECGEEGGVSLKVCKACMHARYCGAECQKNHWPKHKKDCKRRAAELRDQALFKYPPPKEDCPICFLPMPTKLICCLSLPPATISSVPIYDFAEANEGLTTEPMEGYYPCCGKSICHECIHSFQYSGNVKCPFCNSDRGGILVEDAIKDIRKRVESNDAASIYVLGSYYYHGQLSLQQGVSGFPQDLAKATELYIRAADLGNSQAHCQLGDIYHKGGDLKKAKFHYEAAAMAGHEVARITLGSLEFNSGNMERTVKHWTIAASAGDYLAMHNLRVFFEDGDVSRDTIDSTLDAYNKSCVEMRSKERDVYIRFVIDRLVLMNLKI